MNIPGSNLLQIAMSVINPTGDVFLRKYAGEVDNDFGVPIKSWEEPVPMMGCSAQPISFHDIQVLGLEVGKRYIRVWVSADAQATSRGSEGDQFIWGLELWTIVEPTYWIKQDGWNEVVAVYEGQA